MTVQNLVAMETFPWLKACMGSLEECSRFVDWLHEEERFEYGLLKSENRKREWLLSRILLKKLLMAEGALTDPRSCRIAKNRFGRPCILLLENNGVRQWACGISHSGGAAAVALSPLSHLRLGIDVQKLDLRLFRRKDAFTGPFDWLPESIGDDVAKANFLWVFKEAAGKAMGLGLAAGFKKLSVIASSNGTGYVLYGKRVIFESVYGRVRDMLWAVGILVRGKMNKQ